MNATATLSKSASSQLNRQKRLKRVIHLVRWFLGAIVINFLLAGASFLAGLFNWVEFPTGVKISFSPLATYAAPFHVPGLILFFAILRLGLFLTGILILFWLLDMFEAGKFFTAQSVRYIKSLGALVLLDWVLIKILDAMAHRGMEITFGQLVLGLLIYIIAWIMDEGRKIQEEQELTV